MQVIGEPCQAVTDGGVQLHLGQKETITQITAGNAAVPHITGTRYQKADGVKKESRCLIKRFSHLALLSFFGHAEMLL